MACGCQKKVASQFEVTLKDGTTKIVSSEPAARAEISMAGGGTYRAKK